MSYLPAFDAALSDLVKTLHDPTKHKIGGNECKCTVKCFSEQLTARLRRIKRFIRSAALQPTHIEKSPDRKDGQLGGYCDQV